MTEQGMVFGIVQAHLHRARRRWFVRDASRSSLALGFLALILLLMPVSYRAGTQDAHPHTVFQAILDQVRGEQHTHAGQLASPETPAPARASFLALNVPLSDWATLIDPGAALESMLRTHHVTHNLGASLPVPDPDLPELTSVHPGADSGAALAQLLLVLALTLLIRPVRRLWFTSPSLQGIRMLVEGPPPRAGLV
jgi:hypothetical protein